MLTHDELIKKMMKDPAVRAEYERTEREEMPMLDTILKARAEAGLTQAQVAERMSTKAGSGRQRTSAYPQNAKKIPS